MRLHDAPDPETSAKYTVRHTEIEEVTARGRRKAGRFVKLVSLNKDFEPIRIAIEGEHDVQPVAQMLEVLGPGDFADRET